MEGGYKFSNVFCKTFCFVQIIWNILVKLKIQMYKPLDIMELTGYRNTAQFLCTMWQKKKQRVSFLLSNEVKSFLKLQEQIIFSLCNCTPNFTYQEQMSGIIWYVSIAEGRENKSFIDFIYAFE